MLCDSISRPTRGRRVQEHVRHRLLHAPEHGPGASEPMYVYVHMYVYMYVYIYIYKY